MMKFYHHIFVLAQYKNIGDSYGHITGIAQRFDR
jgi:hypothetical protein